MPEEANSKSDNWMERLARVKAARARLENWKNTLLMKNGKSGSA